MRIAKEGQHSCDAPMHLRLFRQAELGKDRIGVLFNRRLGDREGLVCPPEPI